VLCVTYPLDGLRLASFDRRVVGPIDPSLVRGRLEAHFDVRPVGDVHQAPAPGDRGPPRRTLVRRNLFRRTTARISVPGRLAAARPRAVLDRLPAGTTVELTQAPVETLLAACEADGVVLFVLPPPELETLLAIADTGEAVPAKSTFFSPKAGSSMFLRDSATLAGRAVPPPPAYE
jgi:hypothetical protein